LSHSISSATKVPSDGTFCRPPVTDACHAQANPATLGCHPSPSVRQAGRLLVPCRTAAGLPSVPATSSGRRTMAKSGAILALDQGTTSSRAIVFGADLGVLGLGQREFAQHYPASGWVEHDPDDLWFTTVETARQAIAASGLAAGDIAAV